MSAMTSSIAHELAQPLSAMIHNAEALLLMINTKRAAPETSRKPVGYSCRWHPRRGIIERHRTMLRSRQMQKKPVNLQTIVDDTLALVAHDMITRQVEVVTELPANPCVINGDPVLLEQVFVNLVMNAMDAMAETPPGGRRITISSEVRRADVEVSVHDTGPGLPADLAGRLFTPFVTTKQHGLGIGLAITEPLWKPTRAALCPQPFRGRRDFHVTLPVSRQLAPEPKPATAAH